MISPSLRFHSDAADSTQSAFDVFAGEVGEMPVEQPMFDARLHRRIVDSRLRFFNYATELKTVPTRHWLQNLSSRHAQQFLLYLIGHILQNKFVPPVWITSFLRDFFHRHPIFTYAKQRFLGGIARFQFQHFSLESCQRQSQCRQFVLISLGQK